MREIYALSPTLPTVPSHQGEVQTDTRTKDFFAYVKTEFDGKHDQVWDDVTSELVTEHGIVQVGMFGTLPLATMRELIAEKGGKRGRGQPRSSAFRGRSLPHRRRSGRSVTFPLLPSARRSPTSPLARSSEGIGRRASEADSSAYS